MVKVIRRIAAVAGGIGAGACLCIAGSTAASARTVTGVPASTAAAEIGQAFYARVDLGPGFSPDVRVSMNIGNQSDIDGRRSAVRYLAHELNANRQTILVVKKSNGYAWRAPLALDSSIDITFGSRTVPAREVLERIADIDNAGLEVTTPISGMVRLPSLTLPATQAAYELAMQTHTTLGVDYRLTARSPIAMPTELPLVAGTGPARATRYAHRHMRRSVAIVSVPSQPSNASAPVATAPIYGPTPSEVLPQPAEPSFNNPFTSELNPGSLDYGYGYWNSPQPFVLGNGGVTVLPGYSNGQALVLP